MGVSAVHIEGLRVRLGGQEILPRIDLDIPEGKIVGLLGPSGAGKTTLTRAILGMAPGAAGRVEVLGETIPSRRALSSIGYMAQGDALYGELTVWENLLFFGGLFGIRGRRAALRARELLGFVDLEKDAQKRVFQLSGGMKRRLALAIALMHEPKLLLLDEPTVGIDPLLGRRFWEKFAWLRDGGTTVFVTTHVMDEARRCDLLLLLREGRLIARGTPAGLLAATGTVTMEEAFLYCCTADAEKRP